MDEYSIKDLPKEIQDDKKYWITGKTLKTITGILGRLWRGDNITCSGSLTKSSPDGSGINIFGKKQFPSSAEKRAWKITFRAKEDSPGEYEAMVGIGSLLKSLRPDDIQEVTNLETWFAFIPTDLIWIDITISVYTPSAAEIKSYGQGDSDLVPTANPWTSGGYIEAADNGDPDSPQNVLRVMLGYSVPGDSGEPVLTQTATDNLCLEFYPNGIMARPATVAKPSPYSSYGPF